MLQNPLRAKINIIQQREMTHSDIDVLSKFPIIGYLWQLHMEDKIRQEMGKSILISWAIGMALKVSPRYSELGPAEPGMTNNLPRLHS